MTQENQTSRIRGVSSAVQQAATLLREEMTPAEARLWEELRGKRLAGLRFRAQHPVGRFILDFYCPSCKLAIELDGSVHDGQGEQDAARTELLAAYGYRVLRFRNDEVMTEMAGVLRRIVEASGEGEEAPGPNSGEFGVGAEAPRPNSGGSE